MIQWPTTYPTLVEGNLILRPWASSDLEFVFNTCQEFAIQEYTTVPVPYNRTDAEDFITSRTTGLSEMQHLPLVGIVAGQPALSVSLHNVNKFDHVVEIGYWVAAEFRELGLAWRATKLLSDYALAIGFRRVQAIADPLNIGSQKTLTRAGFEFENILRQALTTRSGTQSDALLYAKFPQVDPKAFR